MSVRAFAITAFVFGCALPAQGTAVFPSDHANVANGSTSTYWFPYAYGVSRIQAIYESWDLAIPAGRAITRIGFRQDGSTASTGYQLQLQVLMGSTEKTAADASSTFATNYFSPPTSVFGPALHVLPTFTTATTGTTTWLTLTTPYTPVAGKNLLVEFRIMANNNGGAQFYYYLDAGDFLSPVTSGQVGCPHSGNQTPHLVSRPSEVGGYWYCDLSMAPANQLVVWFVNFGSLTQPYSLSPFMPGIAPTCQGELALTNLLSVVTTANANGGHTFSTLIPNNRSFNDLVISSQVACLDFFAPGGVAVSNGDQMQIGISPAMTAVYAQTTTATTGSLNRNLGVVTMFDWQ